MRLTSAACMILAMSLVACSPTAPEELTHATASPAAEDKGARCPFPSVRPAYLPWQRQSASIPAPTRSYDRAIERAQLSWVDPDEHSNAVSLTLYPLSAPAPSEKLGVKLQGSEGYLHHGPGESGAWWDLDDRCNFLELSIALSNADQERLDEELLRIARSLSDSTDDCPEGIEGKGFRKGESYPPKPYFESFNLWRTGTKTGRQHCLIIVAGQQQRREGEGDPTVYYSSGWLFIFGDYRHDDDGIGSRKVPLPRPVRVVLSSGHGYTAVILLQSLEDCSTVAYDVASATFGPDGFKTIIPCPPRVGRR